MRASCNTRNVNLCFCLVPRSSQLSFLDVFETGSTDCIKLVFNDIMIYVHFMSCFLLRL